MIGNKLVVVEGQEDIVVIHLAPLLYAEVGGDVHETPFPALEVVNVEMTPWMKESQSAELFMASGKDMQTVIPVRHPEGWGRALEILVNKYRSGLGFHSHQLTQRKLATSMDKG